MKTVHLTEGILKSLIREETRKALRESVKSREIKDAIISAADELAETGKATIQVGNEGTMDVRLSGGNVCVSYDGRNASVPCLNIRNKNALVNAAYMAFTYVYVFR